MLIASVGCTSPSEVSYSKDVSPIFTAYCAECHTSNPPGRGYAESLFSTENYANLMKGTKYGPVIIPGDAASSTLVRMVEGSVDRKIRMPHGKGPLPIQDAATIRDWVSHGAKNN